MTRKRARYIRIASSVLIALLSLLISVPAQAQSFDELIEQLGVREMARDYLRPGIDAVGYSINSGYSHTARIDTGFHVWVGAKLISTYIPDADRIFTAKLPAELVSKGYPAEFNTATAVGDQGRTITSDNPDLPPIVFPDGTGLRTFVMAIPQLAVGPVLGTDIILRGLPPSSFDDKVGEFSFYGGGLKHELTHYLDIPFDLAVVAGYQQFHIGDIVDGNSLAGMLQVSRDFASITLFGGVGYESYAINVSYITEDGGTVPAGKRITLDFERRNLRFAIGGALSVLSLIDITVEYSFGIQDNLSLGLGLTI
ncbi:MAG: hypothetical protein KFH87_11595 [Bacteroidetes bacterium]|nr:hypothetical protein [Bacteroidota bacterium]